MWNSKRLTNLQPNGRLLLAKCMVSITPLGLLHFYQCTKITYTKRASSFLRHPHEFRLCFSLQTIRVLLFANLLNCSRKFVFFAYKTRHDTLFKGNEIDFTSGGESPADFCFGLFWEWYENKVKFSTVASKSSRPKYALAEKLLKFKWRQCHTKVFCQSMSWQKNG